MPADMHIFGQAKIDTLSRQKSQLSRAGKGLRGKLFASRIGGEGKGNSYYFAHCVCQVQLCMWGRRTFCLSATQSVFVRYLRLISSLPDLLEDGGNTSG